MQEFLESLITGVMDALEEFFAALTSPTAKFTTDAFLVSLGFLAMSIAAYIFNIFTFVDWKEALTCSCIMLAITLIDSTTRGMIKSNLSKIKDATSKFGFTAVDVESAEIEDNMQYEEVPDNE